MGLDRRSCFPFGFGLLVLLGKPLLLLPSSGNHIIGLHFIRASQRYPGSPHLLSLFPLQLCHRLLRPPWVRQAGLGLIAIRKNVAASDATQKGCLARRRRRRRKKTRLTAAVFFRVQLSAFCLASVLWQQHKHMHPSAHHAKVCTLEFFGFFFGSIACLTQAERDECVGLPGGCEVVAITRAKDLLYHALPIFLHQGFRCWTGCPDLQDLRCIFMAESCSSHDIR